MNVDTTTGEIVYEDEPAEAPFIRTGWNYDMHATSVATGLDCSGDPGKTQQQFKEECDINTIIRNFGLDLPIPENFNMAQYIDLADSVTDFHTAQNIVRMAAEEFMRAPANLRTRFDNDPQKMLDFLEDGKNREEAEKLGLLNPRPEVPPAPPAVVEKDTK